MKRRSKRWLEKKVVQDKYKLLGKKRKEKEKQPLYYNNTTNYSYLNNTSFLNTAFDNYSCKATDQMLVSIQND